MGIMNTIFGGNQGNNQGGAQGNMPGQAPGAQGQGGEQGQQGDPGQRQPPGNKVGQQANNPEQIQDPLAVYANLFQNPKPEEDDTPPSFSLSGDTISKAASGLNFTQGLPKDLVAKALSGDQEAFMEALTHVGRQVYATAIGHTSHLTDQFVGARSEFDSKRLPKQLREHNAVDQATAGIPDNPIVREHLSMIARQIAANNPDATPAWVAEKAKSYYLDMAKSINPGLGEGSGNGQQPGKASEVQDWNTWLNLDK